MIIGPVVILGSGIGCTFQPTLIALQSHVTRSRRAVIISHRNFFRCGGGATGLAVSAAVLQAALRVNLPANYHYLASNTYAPPKVQGPDFEAVLGAYMAASRAVFILQLPVISLCFFGCAFLKGRGLKSPEEVSEEKGDEESKDERKGLK
jgi:hypothetical protein